MESLNGTVTILNRSSPSSMYAKYVSILSKSTTRSLRKR